MAGDDLQGQLIDQLLQSNSTPAAWCFAVHEGPRRVGAVHVGVLHRPPSGIGNPQPLANASVHAGSPDRAVLRCVEHLVGQMWRTLVEVQRSRVSASRDTVSGLLHRDAFLQAAQQRIEDAYEEGEPVAIAVVAVEGLRELDDRGDWLDAVQVVRHVAEVLGRKVRADDLLGRFDDARFLVLLRRVDTALARLIVGQLLSKLRAIPHLGYGVEKKSAAGVMQEHIEIRCGLAGSGVGRPELKTLVARAIERCHRARLTGVEVLSDLDDARGERESGAGLANAAGRT